MTKDELALIKEKCGKKCKYGTTKFDIPICLHPYHRGKMNGEGVEWGTWCYDYCEKGE